MSTIKLGVIGFGNRAQHMAKMMCNINLDARIAAIADPQSPAIQQRLESDGTDTTSIAFYETADEMLDRESLDGVLVGTRCSLHTKMALKVLARDIPLFLEKPISTTIEDLTALSDASSPRVVVSFPLRVSALVRLARKIITDDQIGTIEHVQAYCNVPYGSTYFQNWYRDENETHGLFLQKATHDLDYINYLLVGNRPRVVSAMTSKQVFRGNHPAGLHCSDCPEKLTCYESPYHPSKPSPLPIATRSPLQCAFAVDTGNEDSGSALIQYESGMHVSYSQNFYSRNKAATRGARLIGYRGTIEFDWFTEKLHVYMHQSPHVETHELAGMDAHGGGDQILAANFLGMIRGEEASASPLDEAIEVCLVCLKARESAQTGRFQDIAFPQAYRSELRPVALSGELRS